MSPETEAIGMERRRVQEVGGGTVTVSLPAPWAAEHDVTAGTEVLLSPHQDGSLVVRLTEPHDGVFGTRKLDIEDPDTVPDRLRAAFGAGYERIVLRRSAAFTAEQRQRVLETIRSLTGIDIVEESEHAMVIAGLLSVEEFSVRQTLLQLRYAIDSMHERTLGLLEDGAGTVEPIVDRQEAIDRHVWNVDRLFTRALSDPETMDALGEPRHKLYHYTRIAHLHGRAGKRLLSLAKTVTHPETTISHRDRLRPLLVDAGRAFDEGIEAALNEDATETALVAIQTATDVQDRRSNVRSELAAETHQFAVLDHITGLATDGRQIGDIALQMAIATRDGPPTSTSESDDSGAEERPASAATDGNGSSNSEQK